MSDNKEKKKLRLIDGWAVGTGAMIGATIFVVSGAMSGTAGPAACLSFLLAAGATILIALCCCEVSSAFPRSGGAYIYPLEAFGEKAKTLSFMTGWAFYGAQGLGSAALASTCAFYLNWVFDILFGFSFNPGVFGVVIVIIFGIINMINSELGNATQLASTFIVLAILVIFVIWGGMNVDVDLITHDFNPYGFQGIVSAAALGWAGFSGWSAIPNMASEFKNPGKDVPRSMILSLVTCAVLFGFVILIMNGLLPGSQLAEESAPLAAAASTFTKYGALFVALGGVFAAISTLNGLMMSGAHLLAAMGTEGVFPHIVCKRSGNGTPWIALLITTAGMCLLAATGLVVFIMQMVAFVTACCWIINIVCLFGERKNRPDVDPQVKCPGYPVIPILAIAVAVYMISKMSLKAVGVGAIWLVLGLICYLLFTKTGIRNYCYKEGEKPEA